MEHSYSSTNLVELSKLLQSIIPNCGCVVCQSPLLLVLQNLTHVIIVMVSNAFLIVMKIILVCLYECQGIYLLTSLSNKPIVSRSMNVRVNCHHSKPFLDNSISRPCTYTFLCYLFFIYSHTLTQMKTPHESMYLSLLFYIKNKPWDGISTCIN